jgi:curli biogenesis system outer membrane secretion channel CsgG
MERQDIGKLKDEAELLGKKKQYFQQNLKDVDALLVGSVVELKKAENSNKDGVDNTLAKVAIKLINPETGEVFYRQEGIGKVSKSSSSILGTEEIIGLGSTLEEKAINAAIVNLVNKIVLTLDSISSTDNINKK